MEYHCSLCTYKSDVKQNVIRHNKSTRCEGSTCTSVEVLIECETCKLKFKSKQILIRHRKKSCKQLQRQTQKQVEEELKEEINRLNIKLKEKKTIKQDINKSLKNINQALTVLPIEEKDIHTNNNCLYIIQEREFIKSKQPIYKIGFTKNGIIARTNGYPKQSIVRSCVTVNGNPELTLINLFKESYIHRTDIGNEYFEGDLKSMIFDLFEVSLATYDD
jgi:hypothetical protein